MESRNVALTLEKAREWYNSGSSDLKEVALQAYTKEELTTPKFTDIKTFKDACKVLGISVRELRLHIEGSIDTSYYRHIEAILKLDIIRKALNGEWNPKMTKDTIYYPYVRFYPAGNKAKEAARNNGWEVGETFIADGEKHSLVGGGSDACCCAGLGGFGSAYGVALAGLSLLGCKSKEIAEHMSHYFSKEIFEACYAHHVRAYEWV